MFRPIANNDLIVGAVGVLQFDVVVARLKSERTTWEADLRIGERGDGGAGLSVLT